MVEIIAEILEVHGELTKWRHDIHSHPELAFEECRTASFVADRLESFGIQVIRGVGKTGVVGTLKVGASNKSIGLRADMDALPMDEHNTFKHKSRHPGRMHGCGHDGHTVMLLAAARYLAETRNFDGIVRFIFQPAEEANDIGSGAKTMIDDGLFKRFPVDYIFAVHNAPDLSLGAIATRSGAITASMDLFEVTIEGKGCHGAFPHEGHDPIIIAAQLLTAWQTIISRNINAQDSAVISATSIKSGESSNVIPSKAVIKGSVRALSPAARSLIKERMVSISNGIAIAFGASVEITYRHCYPSCINDQTETDFACYVAKKIFDSRCVFQNIPQDMGSEDFAYMLAERPGCYLIIGSGEKTDDSNLEQPLISEEGKNNRQLDDFVIKNACLLHDSSYDFNDDLLPVGASFFVGLVEEKLKH